MSENDAAGADDMVIREDPREIDARQIEKEATAAIVARFAPGSMDEGEAGDCLCALREAGFSVVRTDDAIKAGLVLPEIIDDCTDPTPF